MTLPIAWEVLRRSVNGEHGYEGTPGVRSPEYPCELFDGRGYDGSGDCHSDGHYLCTECSQLSPDAPRFVEPYAGPSGHRRRFFGRAIGRLDRIRAYRYTMQRAKRWSSVHTW